MAPGLALADVRTPEAPDLIGLLLDDPIGFALEVKPVAAAEADGLEAVEDGVAVALDRPEPSPAPTELAARAFDITYTFAYPDSVRRAGADR